MSSSTAWEVVVLKPTVVFHALLTSQLKEAVPLLKHLQADATAYLLPFRETENETLNDIETYFTMMFQHELARWFDESKDFSIITHYFDFLCCFQLELHRHLVLLETDISQVNALIHIKPKQTLLQYVRDHSYQAELMMCMNQCSVKNLVQNSTFILNNMTETKNVEQLMQTIYLDAFQSEKNRLFPEGIHYPFIQSYESFLTYFDVELHENYIALVH